MRESVASGRGGQRLLRLLLPLVLGAPWLYNAAFGPSPIVLGWLVSGMALAAWCVANAYTDPAWRDTCARSVVRAWLIAGVLSAVIGLFQYFDFPAGSGRWIYASHETGMAYANLRQPNQLATLLAMAFAALVSLAAACRTWRFALLAHVAGLVLAAGMAATGSRTGFVLWWVVVLSAFALPPGTDRRRTLAWVACWTGAYLLASALLPWLVDSPRMLWERLATGAPSCSARGTLWRNVLELIAQRPWTGWGWGELDYAHYAHLYGRQRFCDILDNAHNLPLHLAVELGLPLAIALAVVFAALIWRMAPWHESDPVRRLAWTVMALIGLHSLVEYPLWYGPFQLALLLSIGLLRAPATQRPRARPANLLLHGIIPGCLVLFVSYAAWDYHRMSQLYIGPEQRAAAYRDEPSEQARQTFLFRDQVDFAEYTTTALSPANATQLAELGQRLLHYSPEPRVIQKLIEALVLLGKDEEALWHMARFRAAFPADYAAWAQDRGPGPTLKD